MPRAAPPEPVAQLTWDQVLAFRVQRQLLDPRSSKGAVDVARRLCGVQAQVASAAAFAVAARQRTPKEGQVDRAIRARSLVKTWGVRGTLHLMPVDRAPIYLSSLSRLELWRAKAWERYHGVKAVDVERVIDVLRDVLSAEPIGRDELKVALATRIRSRAVREKIGSGWGELLKPAAWAGVLLQGPPRAGGAVTFVRADAWVDDWTWPEPDDAGPAVVRWYLGAFGPATPAHFAGWWARQQPGKVRPWFGALGDGIVPVDVEGQALWALRDDVARMEKATSSDEVRLLGNFDQYVLGPAGGSAAFIAAAHKADVSRAAGWISRVVLFHGRVVGVWEPGPDAGGGPVLRLWDRVPKRALDTEVARVTELATA